MKKRMFLVLFVLFNLTIMNAQKPTDSDLISLDTLYKPNYPEGVYRTKEDFIKKIPFQKVAIFPKSLYGLTKKTLDKIVHNCYFYYAFSNVRIEDAFAVSYNGHLYFQTSAILKNRNKKDKAQTTNFPDGFVKAILGGENYIYTEAELANTWAKAFAYGGIGGGLGAVMAERMIYGKGIVWDFKNNEFNIFKNCDDYNDFIKDIYKDGIQICKKSQPDVLKIREDLEKIK